MLGLRKTPRIRAGERIYAIGDIHGHLDLFSELIEMIRIDAEGREDRPTTIILIGDVIDRGPSSAQLVERLMDFTRRTERLIVLKGNHEQVMLHALTGDLTAFESWLKYGGDTTLVSWGVPPEMFDGSLLDLWSEARRLVPGEVLRWMSDLPLSYRSGDFFFTHAGIRPDVRLRRQTPNDLMWIREDFLTSEARHPAVIVHGHTINEQGPEMLPNRIGLDTGAYTTGRLTAVGFEGDTQWILQTNAGATEAFVESATA